MINLFHEVSEQCSKITTQRYSTSFSSAIKMLHKDLRKPVYNIYGFVRFADEIVDSFHGHDKELLLKEFKQETYTALERGISLNPILNSFQQTVKQYGIDPELISAFLYSMELDLNKKKYDRGGYEEYIYGSAEAVGLMCLYVFCEGDKKLYQTLQPAARSLGSAFQKINFLRDLKADYYGLDRIYFPNTDFRNFTVKDKSEIEDDIKRDLDKAYAGIVCLPVKARFGVYVAYKYYLSLFGKLKKMQPHRILKERVRVPDYMKMWVATKAIIRTQLNIL
jgi:phytoene/squalene synthetase